MIFEKMYRFIQRIALGVLVALMVSCDKAPRHVIGEHDMVDLLVDIHQAESLINLDPEHYGSDSAKMLLKQSVFMKHHVTAEKFDTSMVWYSKNMAVYTEVYDKVIKRLEDERKDLDVKAGKVVATSRRHKAGRSYKDFGDTADLWTAGRQRVLTSNLGHSVMPFDFRANQETSLGDKYLLQLKSLNGMSGVKAFVGAEYIDGSTTFVERVAFKEGWNEFALQTDSLKKVKRVFGYIKFNVRSQHTVSYVDSIMLLRVHLDRSSYDIINVQKVLDRNETDSGGKSSGSDGKPRPVIKVDPEEILSQGVVVMVDDGSAQNSELARRQQRLSEPKMAGVKQLPPKPKKRK